MLAVQPSVDQQQPLVDIHLISIDMGIVRLRSCWPFVRGFTVSLLAVNDAMRIHSSQMGVVVDDACAIVNTLLNAKSDDKTRPVEAGPVTGWGTALRDLSGALAPVSEASVASTGLRRFERTGNSSSAKMAVSSAGRPAGRTGNGAKATSFPGDRSSVKPGEGSRAKSSERVPRMRAVFSVVGASAPMGDEGVAGKGWAAAKLAELMDLPVPSEQMLRSIFDLTPAEARLAQSLSRGDSLEHVAQSLNIRMTTARSQLAAIFAKTQTCRQAQLVAILSRLAHLT